MSATERTEPGPKPRRSVATVAAAALLPPLGVYRISGAGRDFVIACGLTVLGFLPGAAFALHRALLD